MLDAQVAQRREEKREAFSLESCIKGGVESYLKSLGSSKPEDLYNKVITQMEAPLFEAVLKYTNGNELQSSKILKIARGTLRTKLKKYGIDRLDYKWPKQKNSFYQEAAAESA